jgi:type III restriction enzyme
MILKDYQKIAVKEILWATIKVLNKDWIWSKSIVFKAPTGSGKTIIMQTFLKDLSESHLKDEFAFVWISVNDLSNQSKRSFEKNLMGTNLKFSLLSDIQDKELKNNEILFINWESIRSIHKETWEWKVIAMRDNEKKQNLPTYLKNTHLSWRKVILIVDESHRSLDTNKAQELITNYIKPVLQIEVSATPDSQNYEQKIEVDIGDVIKEGMIKKEILINERIWDLADSELETDVLIIKKAIEKQNELEELYQQAWSNVKPLVLIQLPSEAKKTSDIDKTKLERVKIILARDYGYTLDNQQLAIWLSDDKTNKELIDLENSPVKVLIFKQAIATGWDCPRAQILVMFREIKTISFEIQTVWRILRMPERKHYANDILNRAYVYTDLDRESIGIDQTAKNIIKSEIWYRNAELYKDFTLESFFKSRSDYKDIWFSFYKILAETLTKFVYGKFDEFARDHNKQKMSEMIDISDRAIINNIISDGEILVDIDNHTWERIISKTFIGTKTQEELIKLSFDNFARNQVWPQFTNISRSYNAVIEALYYVLDHYFFWQQTTRLYYQKLILNNKEFFIDILNKAKDIYVPIRQKEVEEKKNKDKKIYTRTIPISQWFSDKAVITPHKKNILIPSYVSFDSTNEQLFIDQYLEKSDLVEFWYKNWTSSEQFFAVPYEKNGETKPFYPDFIVYFQWWTIGIFDPKSWFTLEDWIEKAIGLEKYIENQKTKWRNIIGGLIEVKKLSWTNEVSFLINKKGNYNLKNTEDFEGFGDVFVKKYIA